MAHEWVLHSWCAQHHAEIEQSNHVVPLGSFHHCFPIMPILASEAQGARNHVCEPTPQRRSSGVMYGTVLLAQSVLKMQLGWKLTKYNDLYLQCVSPF